MVDLGDRAFEVLHTPGHTAGSISLWEAATGTLFTGDAIYVDDKLSWDDREGFLRSLERIRDAPGPRSCTPVTAARSAARTCTPRSTRELAS